MAEQDDTTTATAVPTTYAKAPPVTVSLYDEAVRAFYPAVVVRGVTEIIQMAKDKKLDLDIPKEFHEKNLGRFLEESMDLTEFNNGNGLSFYEMDLLVEHNKEALLKEFDESVFQTVVEKMREAFVNLDEGKLHLGKGIFLTHHRAIQRRVTCVYNVVKDTTSKRIIVSFRGSAGFLFSTRDWQTNLDACVVALETPALVKDKMEGILKERVLVHRGFYNYLFDNEKTRENGPQRYDKIVADIKAAINGEEGYSVYITGHSLGGALATMLSFALAGADGPEYDAIPRPITCITFAAPFIGTKGTKIATEHMEKAGLLRSLRMCHPEDIVPTLPFVSMCRHQLMKHVGINVRIGGSGFRIEHSSRANFLTALRNSMFKPVWCVYRWHNLSFHEGRFAREAKELKKLTLDGLYKDPKIVSPEFAEEISF
jgi:hypothetical protein